MKAAAILLAAGRGERLGAGHPKALITVWGKSLLAHVLDTVAAVPEIEGFVVTAPPGREEEITRAVGAAAGCIAVVTGGETRQASVRHGLAALPPEYDTVVCHDVARPLATPELFRAVLARLEEADGVVPVVPIPDTVKRLEMGRVRRTIPRKGLAAAQTPQAFRREALEEAHEAARATGAAATDDAALLERGRYRLVAVRGETDNVKVTRPEDVGYAEMMLERRARGGG